MCKTVTSAHLLPNEVLLLILYKSHRNNFFIVLIDTQFLKKPFFATKVILSQLSRMWIIYKCFCFDRFFWLINFSIIKSCNFFSRNKVLPLKTILQFILFPKIFNRLGLGLLGDSWYYQRFEPFLGLACTNYHKKIWSVNECETWRCS